MIDDEWRRILQFLESTELIGEGQLGSPKFRVFLEQKRLISVPLKFKNSLITMENGTFEIFVPNDSFLFHSLT